MSPNYCMTRHPCPPNRIGTYSAYMTSDSHPDWENDYTCVDTPQDGNLIGRAQFSRAENCEKKKSVIILFNNLYYKLFKSSFIIIFSLLLLSILASN